MDKRTELIMALSKAILGEHGIGIAGYGVLNRIKAFAEERGIYLPGDFWCDGEKPNPTTCDGPNDDIPTTVDEVYATRYDCVECPA